MLVSRRNLLTGFGAYISINTHCIARATPAWTPLGLDATTYGMKPDSNDDQSRLLSRALLEASQRNAPLFLPPGRYRVSGVELPEGAKLIGVDGATQLHSANRGPLLLARGLKRVSLSGLECEGSRRQLEGRAGFIMATDVTNLTVERCAITGPSGIGLSLERCGGRIAVNRFAAIGDTALYSLDSSGLQVVDNVVSGCGNNGIQIWRSTKGHDGSILRGNRIEGIRSDGGGEGQNGNAINVFRAGAVVIEGNQARGCAFSAVRVNGGSNVIIASNLALEMGETAIFAEFAFDGAVISGNLIDGALTGIEMVNFADSQGRLAACTGNVIRNIRTRTTQVPKGEVFGDGIKVEADAAVSGNVIDKAATIGIRIGWGAALRDVSVTGNTVRSTPIGIGVSLSQGAGRASITGNTLAETPRGAIVGMEYERIVTEDWAKVGARPPASISVSGNQAS